MLLADLVRYVALALGLARQPRNVGLELGIPSGVGAGETFEAVLLLKARHRSFPLYNVFFQFQAEESILEEQEDGQGNVVQRWVPIVSYCETRNERVQSVVAQGTLQEVVVRFTVPDERTVLNVRAAAGNWVVRATVTYEKGCPQEEVARSIAIVPSQGSAQTAG